MLVLLNLQFFWGILSIFLPLRLTSVAQIVVQSINFVLSLSLINRVVGEKMFFEWGHYLFLDSLNAVILLIISSLSLLSVLYSVGYINKEIQNGLSKKKARDFYFWMNMFIFAMFTVSLSNNLGILWIALEATTLSTAFLISFYKNREAIEASWKYIILCSVGIALALFGIVLLYFSVHEILGEGADALNWTKMTAVSGQLDPALLKIAFIFVFVGFGTKMGLAPMHFWLPDAHSQAPTPVSALMSGSLLACAFYPIIRVAAILNGAGLRNFTSGILLGFGLFSVLMAAIFIIKQTDYKRLLAYSSMEHMGLVALAFGINSRAGIFAGIFHLVNHAFVKALLFFSAGSILVNFHTRKIFEIRGLFKSLPLTAVMSLLGVLAITGTPPFNIFASEFLIILSGLKAGLTWEIITLIALLVIIFGGFAWHFTSMLMGVPEEPVKRTEDAAMAIPMIVTLSAALSLGFFIPGRLLTLMNHIPALMGVE